MGSKKDAGAERVNDSDIRKPIGVQGRIAGGSGERA
jgi:hypothetical protein